MKLHASKTHRFNKALALLAVGLLSACSSSDPVDTTVPPGDYAYIATRSTNYTSAQIEAVSLESNTTVQAYPGTLSDIRVVTDGADLYQLGRLEIDSLTKFDLADTANTQYQFSTNSDGIAGSNPHKVVFASETKAYVMLYGRSEILIVDPSATLESEFITGSIDISSYNLTIAEPAADASPISPPNATDAVLVGDELYVLLQRLTDFSPIETGYVAVFDTTTDTEVDTGQGSNGLLGIELTTLNPENIHYIETLGDVLVTGRGDLYNGATDETVVYARYQGGIEAIDTTDYSLSMLLDDGTEAANEGFFNKSVIVSPTIGYLTTYNGSSWPLSDTLRQFNPTTGVLSPNTIPTFVDTQIVDLAVAPDGNLWVGVPGATAGDGSGYYQVDPAANAVVGELIPTLLAPMNVVFLTVPEPVAE